MKKYITLSLLSSLMFLTTACKKTSCNSDSCKKTCCNNESCEKDMNATQIKDKTNNYDAVDMKTYVDDKGRKIQISFDNENDLATIFINNEMIELKQEITASGSKYSNKDYTYIEHHGEMTLTKNGEIIFEKK